MATIAKKSAAKPFTLTVAGGQNAFIRGHVSKTDESIKDRKFQVSTHAGNRQKVIDFNALNDLTAMDVHRLILQAVGVSFPITAVSAALNTLSDRVASRQNGTTQSGPIETIPVAVDSNGRKVIEAIRNQKTGEWSLSLGPVEQQDTWFTPVTENRASVTEVEGQKIVDRNKKGQPINKGTINHEAEAIRKLEKCTDSAVKQSKKWFAQTVKTQSLSSLCALINKVIPQPKGPDIRSFRLIGSKAITCDSIAIGGQSFTNMMDLVSAFRPDLVSLFNQTTEKVEVTG
tara:strand:- start:1149 stop:2009 length:861 start_codon:yes stop_codon:yes gene_type:complete